VDIGRSADLTSARDIDNVLQDMVQRLRAIELLLRTQNELLTRVLVELTDAVRRRATSASGLTRPASRKPCRAPYRLSAGSS
jgi:hypothetical protein